MRKPIKELEKDDWVQLPVKVGAVYPVDNEGVKRYRIKPNLSPTHWIFKGEDKLFVYSLKTEYTFWQRIKMAFQIIFVP